MATPRPDPADIEVSHYAPTADEKTHRTVYQQAQAATDKEHSMTLMEGIRTYPKAIAWACTIGLCIAME